MQSKIEKVLEDQLCFLLYASSREMTKKYKPLLDKLEVTYPQYLVLLLLWEQDTLTVKKLRGAPCPRLRNAYPHVETNGAEWLDCP